MMEIVEYRPGKWVKVVDGRIVGRATADEVAAWQAQAQEAAADPSPLPLDIDLDLDGALQTGGPGHTLDVPLKPAFERRRPATKRRAKAEAAQPPASEDPEDITIEMAIARDAMARRRASKGAPKEEAPGGPVMVRRRVPRHATPSMNSDGMAEPKAEAPPAEAEAKPKRRATSRRSKAAEAEAPAPAEELDEKPRRKRRATRAKAAKAEAPAPAEEPEEKPKPKRRTSSRTKAAEAETLTAAGEPEAKPQRRRKTTRRTKAAEAEASAPAEEPEEKPRRKRRTSSQAKAAEAEAAAPTEETKPKRKHKSTRRRSRSKEAEAPATKGPEAEAPTEDTKDRGPSFWWIYNTQGQPVSTFLKDWLPRYKTKFGHEATRVLCHEEDYAAVQEYAADLDVEVSSLVQPGHFYLSHREAED